MRIAGLGGRARLGLVAGAFFMAVAQRSNAQVVPPPGSEVPIPPKPKTDSTKPKPDSVKLPLGRSTDPHTADIGPQYTWDRSELFASGALNLADLLERIPGITSFRTGYVNSQKFVAINGQLSAIRVFYDGLELNNLNSRNGPLLDLNEVQLWTLERVSIERLGGDLRVYLRSLQADRTLPSTRVDLSTGDDQTNIYRGFYGKRFSNGGALQFAGQQFSTTSARFGGGGDGLSVLGRIGTGGKKWSVDAFANRTQSTRVIQPTFGAGLAIPAFSGTNSLAYARVAIGHLDDGPWFEAIASTRRFSEDTKHVLPSSATTLHVLADTVDTATSMQQYLVTAGFRRGPLEVAAADRIRRTAGQTTHAPNARLQFDTPLAFAEVTAEHDDFAKQTRTDAVARISPMPFVVASGAISHITSSLSGSNTPTVTSARFEGGVRLWGPWLIAGFLTRDTAFLTPLRAIDTAYVAQAAGRRSGFYVGARGTIIGALGMDVIVTQWASADAYRPKYQTRSELNLNSRWLSRFPSGNFGIHAAAIHEFRSEVNFPVADGVRTTTSSNVFSGVLEIRIMRAVLSYQIRNLAGELHQIVPDFYMPRALNLYGVRWEFVN